MAKGSRIRYIFLGLALLFALPAGWGMLSGFSTWLSPYITINSVLALKSFVLLNIIGFIVLVLVIFRRNFFCRYLCPVGCLLNHVPAKNKNRGSFFLRKIPCLGIWMAVITLAGALAGYPLFIYLDPVSLFNAFFSAFLQTSWLAIIASIAGLLIIFILQFFFPGLWCFRLCPLGGLQMLATVIRSLIARRLSQHQKIDLGRRLFIGSASGAIISMALPWIMKDNKKDVLRPPAAIGQENFWSMCTRCGSCLKSCPTDILKQDVTLNREFLTPEVEFITGYCLETCNNCGVVCPSGAITKFEVEAKPLIHMGLAVVEVSDCLLTSLKECDRCKSVCPYNAVEIIGTGNFSVMEPVVSGDKCVGCGACQIVCPVSCIRIMNLPVFSGAHIHNISELAVK